MSDLPPDPPDDLLRDALRAEADGVTADPELLDRIRSATATAPSPWGRRVPRLLAAAAAAVLVGLVATVLSDEPDDQRVDVVDDPDLTPTTTTGGPDMFEYLATSFPCEGGFQTVFYLSPAATSGQADAVRMVLEADARVQTLRFLSQEEIAAALAEAAPGARWAQESIPTAYLVSSDTGEDDITIRGIVSDHPGVTTTHSTDCEPDPAQPAARPMLVVLVREDGWLVAADLETGEQTELYTAGDPTDAPSEGGPQFVDDVELSPDGEWVYFSTCCEPASGNTFRIPIGGGEPELVAVGAYPRLSPDGRYLATDAAGTLIVTPVDRDDASVDLGCCPSKLAWSPDGLQLAVVHGTGGSDDDPQVRLFDWDGTSLRPADQGKPDNPGRFVAWTPEGVLSVSSGGPVADDRAMRQDASYRWILWVDEAGVVREQAGFESGDRTPIDGLPEALAADW